MNRQIIITVGREYGSGGHFIAAGIAEKLGIKLYDKKFIQELGFDREITDKYDEKARNVFLSRTVGGFSNSIEDALNEKVFEFIREKAKSGESFVIVGRCAEYVLRDFENVFSVFVLGDMKDKVNRIMSIYNLSERKAMERIKLKDKRRKSYHNFYSDTKWGDSRGYDLCINSSKFGVEETAEAILGLIPYHK